MKYISLAAYNNELIVVTDMDAFTNYFCYAKKQRYGSVDILVPKHETEDDAEDLIVLHEVEDAEVPDDDVL
jgi:hypothetical protein